jgi:hypothetical protein
MAKPLSEHLADMSVHAKEAEDDYVEKHLSLFSAYRV